MAERRADDTASEGARRAKWEVVADALRKRVEQMSPGDRLPYIRDLVGEYGVSRSPILDALAHLQGLGWVIKQKRRYEASRPDLPKAPVAEPRRSAVASNDVSQQQGQHVKESKWRKAADRLRNRCRRGQPGTPLGSLSSLASEYGVSRSAMTNDVMVALTVEGWVRKEKRRYVISRPRRGSEATE